MKKKLLIVAGIIFAFVLVGCGDKEEFDYGGIPGKAEGIIDFTNGNTDIDIKDVKVDQGGFVDYTSGIVIKGVDDDYVQISADASAVDNYTPGTYDVVYTISYGDKTYRQTSRVTVNENENYVAPTPKKVTNVGDGYYPAEIENANNSSEPKDIGTAKITLLSGETIEIKQTTARFISRTYTEYSETTRDGVVYNVTKLIVEFNTGESRVLETIEQPAM